MKYTKLIVSIILLISMFSCDKSTTGPVGGSSIIGEWKESNAVINLSLTTNSAQQASNFLNSTGEIAVTGDYNTKLKLMLYFKGDEEDDPNLTLVNLGLAADTDTSYMLTLDPTEVDKNGDLDVSVDDETEFEDNLTNLIDYTFDKTTLNIENSTVTSPATVKSATLNGSVSLDKVNIPANQATMLSLNSEHFYDFGNTITTFYEDSTFTSSESTEAGDSTGTWTIIGDTLKITVELEVEDPETEEISNVDTTLSFIYINYGNTFNISQSFDICEGLPAEGTEDETGCDDVLNTIEFLFGLDEGSLVKAELIYQLFFEKIPDNQVAKISNNSKNLWEISIPQRIEQYLANFKK